MTEKRFYYNTFYHADDMSRVLEYEIIDRQSYPDYPNHDEKEDIPQWYIYIGENDSGWQDMLVDLLNALHEENERLRNQLSHIQYRFFEYKNKRKIITEKEVKKTLQKYFNRYTQMALELRHDKYGNGVCHDVTEILMEIADDLGVKLE